MTTEIESKLDLLLKRTQEKTWKPLPDELNVLVDAFSPSNARSIRTKAYVVLSAASQALRQANPSSKADPQASVDSAARPFISLVTAKLSNATEREIISGLSFLAALFQVDWEAASTILRCDGVLQSVVDSVDLYPASLSLSQAAAQLVSQAAGHKACRALIPSQCIEWLETKAKRSQDTVLRAAAAVALVKLSQGAEADAAATTGRDKPIVPAVNDDLVALMKRLVVTGDSSTSLSDSVEGLAYMSVNFAIREQLSQDTPFLRKLFALIPQRKSHSLQTPEGIATSPIYGVVAIISNICAYRPRLSEEEAQIAKLRRMATNASKEGGPELDPLEDDESAKARGKRLLQAGALDALTAAVRASDSRATRLAVGKTLLNLVEDQENRGKVLQSGGAKALVTTIQGLLPPPPANSEQAEKAPVPSLDRSELECIQALAKLAITASPVQVFGPDEGALYDAIRPFAILLVHSSSTLLQRFEAIMALTNFASQSPEVATRIAKFPDILNKVELLMLEDHALIRRAATELVCNLIAGSEEIFNKYGGDKASGSKSKLHVLLALCDVDDLHTRLAASGALAMLTSVPDASQLLLELEQEKHRALAILGQLIDPFIHIPRDEEDEETDETPDPTPDPGLIHRGATCVRNLLAGVDVASRKQLGERAQEIGLSRALVSLFRSGSNNPNNPALVPAAEALKLMLDSGVSVAA